MSLPDTTYLNRCIDTLEKAMSLLNKCETDSIEYEMYRSASVKEFEIILEQSGKLLKKSLKQYLHSSKAADQLVFKDIFRHASNHSIISLDECNRWLEYRDNRNSTAHDYGQGFAESTILLLPQFILDARSLAIVIHSRT